MKAAALETSAAASFCKIANGLCGREVWIKMGIHAGVSLYGCVYIFFTFPDPEISTFKLGSPLYNTSPLPEIEASSV